MFIAVGYQRRKRVHMVRVLYHGDLIRLDREGEREMGDKNNVYVFIPFRIKAEKPGAYT